jgi:hypothetical protein
MAPMKLATFIQMRYMKPIAESLYLSICLICFQNGLKHVDVLSLYFSACLRTATVEHQENEVTKWLNTTQEC